MDKIRPAYYIRGLELMKLIFAGLDVSLTMGVSCCYKIEGFLKLISNTHQQTTRRVYIRIRRIRLTRRLQWTICVTNIYTTQITANFPLL